MKKVINTLVIMAICLGIHSCVSEEKDIFDQSAAIRLQEKIKEYTELLESSEYGWTMEYYPETDLSLGGFRYFCVFKDGQVTMTSEVGTSNYPVGSEVVSLYRFIGDQGPVLTFDSYNEIFHYFSEPAGKTDTDGFAGDYEFVAMKAEGDEIRFKGKKHGNIMRMTRLTKPAATYLEELLEVKENLAVSRARILVGRKEHKIIMLERQMMVDGITVPFVYTDKGFKLYKPVKIDEVLFQEFTLDSDEKGLSEITADVHIPYPTPVELACYARAQWYFNLTSAEETCPELLAMFIALKADLLANRLERLNDIYMGYSLKYPESDPNPFVFAFKTTLIFWPTEMIHGCEFEASNIDEVYIVKKEPGLYYQGDYIARFDPIVNLISNNSPYELELDNEDNPSSVKYTSSKNPLVWFVVKKK